MNLKAFLKFVEIQTKLASVLPFLLGIIFSFYRYGEIKVFNIIFMFVSLLFFDMTTTSVNNYIDYKKAVKKDGYNYENHNAIVKYNLTRNQALITIFVLLSVAVLSGVILFLMTDWFVLLIGIISFTVAYSWGPIPISRMPLGEFFSGMFMGFVIFLLSVYINIHHLGFISLNINGFDLSLFINMKEFLIMFFVSFPMVITIGNIMLANNICDLQDDIINKRYTLPYYIGQENAVKLFKLSYFLIYINIIVLVVLNILPLISLVLLISIVPIIKNIKQFEKIQSKKDTFVFSVKNHFIISFLMIVGVLISSIFNL
jgi:1,4-dihydroxy-2-naphthoate octaprenyltransferase